MDKFEPFDKIEWCGYKWIKRPFWGDNHPDEKNSWFDKDCTEIDGDNNIILNIKKNPKMCDVLGQGQIMKEFAKGFVRTTEEFKYGTFEWEMKVPEGKYLWPALWLASDYSWPPEIDCMEGWSGTSPKYIKKLLWRNIFPTMHWSENCDSKNGKHIQEGKSRVWRCWLKCNDFDKYKIVWTPDYVDIFYNGHKVKRFNNKEMLEHMNKPEVKMHAIMSVSFHGRFEETYDEIGVKNKPMVVKSFKYTPLQ